MQGTRELTPERQVRILCVSEKGRETASVSHACASAGALLVGEGSWGVLLGGRWGEVSRGEREGPGRSAQGNETIISEGSGSWKARRAWRRRGTQLTTVKGMYV